MYYVIIGIYIYYTYTCLPTSPKEKSLLFEDNVYYYVSNEDANSNPTRYHVSVTPNGHVVKYAN